MNMKEYFIKIYSYNLWANRKIMACLERQQVTDEKILSIFGHLVSAQFIWLNRFKDLPKSEYLLWGKFDLPELRAMIEKASERWNEFIDNENSFDRILKYQNYVGDYYENAISDIMIHLVNHGSYHRGQVALLLRQKGFEPVNTDMITWHRVISGQLKD
jgi:uncharacterized damage-inducible protein DinB